MAGAFFLFTFSESDRCGFVCKYSISLLRKTVSAVYNMLITYSGEHTVKRIREALNGRLRKNTELGNSR